MSALLAIDPGTTESGWVMLTQTNVIHGAGIWPNEVMLERIDRWGNPVAIERFEARGMSIGDDSIITILWTGRFMHAAAKWAEPTMVKRSEVKSYLCGTQQAKDTNIRRALIDIFGPPGSKNHPGPTYGVTKHAWAALGVAATVRQIQPRVEITAAKEQA